MFRMMTCRRSARTSVIRSPSAAAGEVAWDVACLLGGPDPGDHGRDEAEQPAAPPRPRAAAPAGDLGGAQALPHLQQQRRVEHVGALDVRGEPEDVDARPRVRPGEQHALAPHAPRPGRRAGGPGPGPTGCRCQPSGRRGDRSPAAARRAGPGRCRTWPSARPPWPSGPPPRRRSRRRIPPWSAACAPDRGGRRRPRIRWPGGRRAGAAWAGARRARPLPGTCPCGPVPVRNAVSKTDSTISGPGPA